MATEGKAPSGLRVLVAIDEVAQVAVQTPAAHKESKWRPWAAWALAFLLLGGAIYWGIGLRRWIWDQTAAIRILPSLHNAIEWGNYAKANGVLEVYDTLYTKFGPDGDYTGGGRIALDYPPLRLLIMYTWRNWAYEKYARPGDAQVAWRPDYEFTQPMLRLNLACELAGMAGMFLLVYRWMRICTVPAPDRWWSRRLSQGWGRTEHLEQLRALPSTVGLRAATCAALLMWCNPAMIYNAHAYPQWDVWLLPPVIWAAFLGLINWWLPAGIAIGICAMAKGQILFAFPLFIGWPLLLGNLSGALRIAAGFAAGVGLVVWPWLTRGELAHAWMIHVGVSAALILAAGQLPRHKRAWWFARGILTLAAAIVLFMPAIGHGAGLVACTVMLSALAAAIMLIGGRRWILTSLCVLWAGGLALTVPLFNASMAWYEIGIKYGTRHWKQLFWCLAPNLGSILQVRFQWRYADVANMSWVPWLGLGEVPIRQVMMALYVIAMALCIVGIARHRRNHDPRFLVALAAPLMMAYTLLPQMIDRYLMWPAALLSAYAAISFSGLLLWLAISGIACLMMFGFMLTLARQSDLTRDWLPAIQSVFPDIGWAVFVLAGVVLWLAVSSSRPRSAIPPLC